MDLTGLWWLQYVLILSSTCFGMGEKCFGRDGNWVRRGKDREPLSSSLALAASFRLQVSHFSGRSPRKREQKHISNQSREHSEARPKVFASSSASATDDRINTSEPLRNPSLYISVAVYSEAIVLCPPSSLGVPRLPAKMPGFLVKLDHTQSGTDGPVGHVITTRTPLATVERNQKED